MMDEGLLSIIPAGCGQLEKMLITLEHVELHGIFGSTFSYLIILVLSSSWYEALPSIILPRRGNLVKVITLGPNDIF